MGREHALLVRSLGVSQLVVAVNKLDTVSWSQQRFTEVRDKLKVFLTKQVDTCIYILAINFYKTIFKKCFGKFIIFFM